jgi:signal transduction histidine kinase
MCVAITILLILGMRITALNRQGQHPHLVSRPLVQALQQTFYLSELQTQLRVEMMERISESVHQAQQRLLGGTKHLLDIGEERRFAQQAIAVRHQIYRLTESMAPRALRQRGLAAALQEGALAYACQSAALGYRLQLQEHALEGLSESAQLALYRAATEAAAYLYAQAWLGRLELRLRSGVRHGQRWIAFRVTGWHNPVASKQAEPGPDACELFCERLGAVGEGGIRALDGLAMLYGGRARASSGADRCCVRLLCYDNAPPPRTDALPAISFPDP